MYARSNCWNDQGSVSAVAVLDARSDFEDLKNAMWVVVQTDAKRLVKTGRATGMQLVLMAMVGSRTDQRCTIGRW